MGARPERRQRCIVEHPVILIERRHGRYSSIRCVDRPDLGLDLRHQPAIVAGQAWFSLYQLPTSNKTVDAEMFESSAGFYVKPASAQTSSPSA